MVVGLLSHFLLFVGKGPISNVVQNEKDRHDVRTFLRVLFVLNTTCSPTYTSITYLT